MIKQTDLRIGNYVEFDGKFEKIDCLSDKFPFFENYKYGAWVIDYQNINPIPLSNEWLEKLGFEKIAIDESNIEEGDKNEIVEVCLFPYENTFRYQYVHQVQNLFNAITGIELTVSHGITPNGLGLADVGGF